MNKPWINTNKDRFIRDLMRDYCHVYCEIEEQHIRFATSKTVSYSIIKELLEETMSIGAFSRLKDTAHSLFRIRYDKRIFGDNITLSQTNEGEKIVTPTLDEETLDWLIGYAFHECVKLKEDAYQQGHYLNRLLQLKCLSSNPYMNISLPANKGSSKKSNWNFYFKNPPLLTKHSLKQKNILWLWIHSSENILPTLINLSKQTTNNIQHALTRILQILSQAQTVLIHYLCKQKTNHNLARFLVLHENIVQRVFKSLYEPLLNSLYPQSQDLRYILAAQDCFNGGRYTDALSILKANNFTGKYNEISLKLQKKASAHLG